MTTFGEAIILEQKQILELETQLARVEALEARLARVEAKVDRLERELIRTAYPQGNGR